MVWALLNLFASCPVVHLQLSILCMNRYMLSEEGREAARDCLLRSGLVDSTENLVTTERLPNLDASNISDLEFVCADSTKEATIVNSSLQKKTIDVPPESLDRVYIPFASGYFFPVFFRFMHCLSL